MVSATCGGVGCQELHQEGVKKTGHLHHHHCHHCFCHHPQGPHCLHHQVLAAVRRGLTGHPLDLRGSRRALEAAQVIVIISNNSFGGIIATIISPPTVAFTLDITHKSWSFVLSDLPGAWWWEEGGGGVPRHHTHHWQGWPGAQRRQLSWTQSTCSWPGAGSRRRSRWWKWSSFLCLSNSSLSVVCVNCPEVNIRHSHLLSISLFPGWQALQCLTRTPSLSSLSSSPLSSGSTIASRTWLETLSHSFLLFIFWYFILFRVLHFLFLHTFPFPFIFPITPRQSCLPPGDHWEAVELPTSNPPAWPDKLPGQSSKITN